MSSNIHSVVRRVVAGVAALTTMASLAACGGSSGDTGATGAAKDSTVTIFNGATGTINENFNPFSPTALQPTLGVIYEPLFWYNLAKESDPKPMLATDTEWNEDGSVLTITTRDGVKWQDGEPFTAEDVAYTFEILRKTPSLNVSGLAATAKAVDDTHVTLTFPEANSYVAADSALGNQAIVPKHIWEKIDDPVAEINSDPIGTGAFKLNKFTSQSYSLDANKDYWGGAPKISGVRYIALSDADGATNALLAGKVDWMSSFIPGLDQILKDNKEISYVNTPQMTTIIMTCSSTDAGCKGPQTDTAVRQAMNLAMDRDQLNKLAGGGFASIGSPTLLPPDITPKWIANKDLLKSPNTANVDKAKEILDAAGWTEGSDGIREKDGQKLSMTIQTVSGWADYISINDTLRQQFKEVGIDLKTTQLAWNEWNDKEQKGDFELSLDSFGLGVTDDPYHIYNPKFTTENMVKVGETGGQNLARYSNAKVDAAVKAASQTDDFDAKLEQYGIVQEQIANDLPYVPIYVNSMLTEFNNSKATGWPTDDNKYALAASWKAWDQGIVLQTIEPAK